MQQYIAFLRAINVGGHTVRMDMLRGLFESLGFNRVETFIASGNVSFETHEGSDTPTTVLETAIEKHLRAALGYEVATFLRTPAELDAIASHQPFAPADLTGDHITLSVAFLHEPLDAAAQQPIFALRTSVDEFHFNQRELYWLCRVLTSQSTFSGAVLEKAIRKPATIRNITTIKKLAAKYPHSASAIE